MHQPISTSLALVFMLSLASCNGSRAIATDTAKHTPTQKEDEAVMMMALHHNRDEVFAHKTSLGDFSWQKTPAGLLNWDCSLAIIEKHNQKYLNTPWELEGIELRDKMFGPPTGERKIKSNACAEETIQAAQKAVDLSKAFEKR
jgi:hypothetical protein